MKIGVMFSVCDGPLGDEKHFDRFLAELTRLGFPFAVNFDHCTEQTRRLFQRRALYLGGYEDNDPESHFDESFRQKALDVLLDKQFDWALSMDVDETLERDAVQKIHEATELGADIVDFPVLDLWGDERHFRRDGPFGSSHREKLFNLREPIAYYHPTVHAPRVKPKGREVVVVKYPCHVLHWGIMCREDAVFHTERWNRIYTRRVGNNPYASGFYSYIMDESIVPELHEVPAGI